MTQARRREVPKGGLQRPRLISGLVIIAAAVALWEPAAAEPRPERARLERQLAELKRQARELQEQIRRLEEQLAPPPPLAAPSIASFPDDCELPFYLDSSGLKRVRSECLDANREPSCDMPFLLDEHGIRRVRPGCESETPVLAQPINE